MSLVIVSNSFYCHASERDCYSNLNEVMKCFIGHEDGAYKYELYDKKDLDNFSIITYILDSQKWPIIADDEIPTTTWRHKMVMYIPKEVIHNKALFYISGGENYDKQGREVFNPSREFLDYSSIALTNKVPVVVLEDVPNQYLFINSLPKKEDHILAITYRKVMQDPIKNAYLAGHLPMVKSVVKAMDASQEILLEYNVNITEFVVVGASKRGWVTWLSGLEDNRVSAIIPVVIDILNVQKNINHICNSYKTGCPPALLPYKDEGIVDHINSNSFADLMIIEDPFSYINLPQYSKQASIPKYIINAGGDDFYSPDSSKFYFKDLKGENYIRYLPEAMHYFAGNPISDSLNNMKILNKAVSNYFYFHINNIPLPDVSWNISEAKITVDSPIKPEKIKLWTARNEDERNFRFLHSYGKIQLGIKGALVWLSKYLPWQIKVCDTCYEEMEVFCNDVDNGVCHIDVDLPVINKGWSASFVELYYNIDGREFVVSTEMGVFPDSYPEHVE